MSARRLEIIVPERIFIALDKIEKMRGVRKEDLLVMALVKLIEEFEKGGG
ncbi:MAG: hypothetical protein QXH10_09275 [Ignisphaera sp.]|uniref:DNA-binding protein n=1 Tax=Ligamenvirales sp. TaxID=2832923 RepID=A0AAU6PX57_9VIRU